VTPRQSEPEAKNLFVVSGEKSGCFVFAQHDIQLDLRIATKPPRHEGREEKNIAELAAARSLGRRISVLEAMDSKFCGFFD
jgi:hypothetical protein